LLNAGKMEGMAKYRIRQTCKLDQELHRNAKIAAKALGLKLEHIFDEGMALWLRKNAKTLKKKGIVCSV
jgi:hypothetical protein